MSLSYCKKCKGIVGYGLEEEMSGNQPKDIKKSSVDSCRKGLCLECYEQGEVK